MIRQPNQQVLHDLLVTVSEQGYQPRMRLFQRCRRRKKQRFQKIHSVVRQRHLIIRGSPASPSPSPEPLYWGLARVVSVSRRRRSAAAGCGAEGARICSHSGVRRPVRWRSSARFSRRQLRLAGPCVMRIRSVITDPSCSMRRAAASRERLRRRTNLMPTCVALAVLLALLPALVRAIPASSPPPPAASPPPAPSPPAPAPNCVSGSGVNASSLCSVCGPGTYSPSASSLQSARRATAGASPSLRWWLPRTRLLRHGPPGSSCSSPRALAGRPRVSTRTLPRAMRWLSSSCTRMVLCTRCMCRPKTHLRRNRAQAGAAWAARGLSAAPCRAVTWQTTR